MAQVKELTIVNVKGLHARAAAKFVKVVNSHQAEVKVTRVGNAGATLFDEQDDYWAASGGSVLGMLTLGAEKGAKLRLEADGADAEQLLAALEDLISRKFDEGE